MAQVNRAYPLQFEEISSVPPEDTGKIWRNENFDGEAFFYDGTDWVSSHLYEFTFNRVGNSNNNALLRVGNAITNPNTIGFIPNSKIKLESWNITRGNPSSGTVNIVSAGSIVDSATVGINSIESGDFNTSFTVSKDQHLVGRWLGPTTRNIIFNIFYRKSE